LECNTFNLQGLLLFPSSGVGWALPGLGWRWYVFLINVSTTVPPIKKQLVLELEGGVSVLELCDLLPSSVCNNLAHPLHQKFPFTTVETGVQDLLRLRQQSAMLDWRKTRHNNRRGARELLEKHHVEDIMDVTLGR
jgi:hypothetical protein